MYEGIKSPASACSGIINITPASQQLACKLLELAYALGLEVCTVCFPLKKLAMFTAVCIMQYTFRGVFVCTILRLKR